VVLTGPVRDHAFGGGRTRLRRARRGLSGYVEYFHRFDPPARLAARMSGSAGRPAAAGS